MDTVSDVTSQFVPFGTFPSAQLPSVYPTSLIEPPKEMDLTPAQEQKLDDLALQFLDDVGGADQEPDDPAYRDRWNQAVPENDSQYKLFFGSVAFVQQQLRAYQATMEEISDQQSAQGN